MQFVASVMQWQPLEGAKTMLQLERALCALVVKEFLFYNGTGGFETVKLAGIHLASEVTHPIVALLRTAE